MNDKPKCQGRWCEDRATIRFAHRSDASRDRLYCDACATSIYSDCISSRPIGPLLSGTTSVNKPDEKGQAADLRAAEFMRRQLYANLGKPIKTVDQKINYAGYEAWSQATQTQVDKWMHEIAIARAMRRPENPNSE